MFNNYLKIQVSKKSIEFVIVNQFINRTPAEVLPNGWPKHINKIKKKNSLIIIGIWKNCACPINSNQNFVREF